MTSEGGQVTDLLNPKHMYEPTCVGVGVRLLQHEDSQGFIAVEGAIVRADDLEEL